MKCKYCHKEILFDEWGKYYHPHNLLYRCKCTALIEAEPEDDGNENK